MIKQISYRVDGWLRGSGTFHSFSATDPAPGKECPEAEHDAKGGIRVVEFEGEPSWEGWEAAPTETMVDRFYRE